MARERFESIGNILRFYFKLKIIFQYVFQYQKIASLPENRALRPWIITMGHRPMYCTNADKDDCTKFDDRVNHQTNFIYFKLFKFYLKLFR